MNSPSDLVEQILGAVELVPIGRVVTYGDVAELVGTGPRVVGRVMAASGGSVPWWRVVSASGQLPDHLMPVASQHWDEENIPTTRSGACVVRACRANLTNLADQWLALQENASAEE